MFGESSFFMHHEGNVARQVLHAIYIYFWALYMQIGRDRPFYRVLLAN